MIFLNFIIKAYFFVSILPPLVSASEILRFQHWNLRYDSINDHIPINVTLASLNGSLPDEDTITYYTDYEEVTWSVRRIGIANDVIFNGATIFTVNEGIQNQITDLKYLLGSLGDGDVWEYIGVGRDDGTTGGEYEAIFYNTNKIQLESNYTIWLSNTPFEPSRYPGAGSYRTATIGRFKTNDDTHFTLFNTHLDDQSDDQRKLGASMLRYLGAYEYEFSSGPVFLMGDFNSHYEGDDSGAYDIVTGEDDLETMNSTFTAKYESSYSDSFTFSDFYVKTEVSRRSGHYDTFTGFKAIGDYSEMSGKIDFQFGGNVSSGNSDDKSWKVLRTRINENFYDMQFHLSDHRSVICDVEF